MKAREYENINGYTQLINTNYEDEKGGGGSYKPGDGIKIENDIISVDNTVAKQTSVASLYNSIEDLRTDLNGVDTEFNEFKENYLIDMGGIVEELNNKASKLNLVENYPTIIGTYEQNGTKYNLYEMEFKTGNLGDNTSKQFDIPNVANITIERFIDASGILDNGHIMNNGRTDNLSNVAVLQQLSKGSKQVYIRTYADLTSRFAHVYLKFIGLESGSGE